MAARLNELEASSYRWAADPLTDTGPLLRLAGRPLAKAERYADPDGRPIYASSLAAGLVEQEVVSFLQKGYAGVQPRKYWTWAEVRAVAQ